MASTNTIPDIDSKTSASKHFSMQDGMFIVMYVAVAYMLDSLVNPMLTIPYMIFNILVSVYLVLPSRYNKGRSNLASLYMMIVADKFVYKQTVK